MKSRRSFSAFFLASITLVAFVTAGLVTINSAHVGASGATTRYVATNGTVGDGSSCASPGYVGASNATIQSALDAASSGDTVYLCSGTYSIGTRLDITKSVTLSGSGSATSILDGGNSSQILMIQDANPAVTQSEITVYISNLSFINGRAVGNSECTDGVNCGGAIYIEGESRFHVSNSYFKNNYAGFVGGAIARLIGNYETVPSTIVNSTFELNRAHTDGGGVATLFGYGLEISESTFVENAIEDRSGAALIANFANASVKNSTFIDNTGPAGTTVLYGDVSVEHSILAQSSPSMISVCNNQDLSGSRGNLITDSSCGFSTLYPATPSTNSARVSFGDLKFGTLSYRGYSNKTVPLYAGSVALDFWSASCAGTDQHGFTRPQGALCDVGSYERPTNQITTTLSGWTYPSATFTRVGNAAMSVSTPATDSAGVGVEYSTSTPTICSVNSSTGTITGLSDGTCTLTASVNGTLLVDEVSSTQSITLVNFVRPTNVAAPSFTGTLRSGLEVDASTGDWTQSPSEYKYQWSRSSSEFGSYTNISGAISAVYELTDDDVQKFLRVQVVAVNAVGDSAAELSASRGPVTQRLAIAAPTASAARSITGGFKFTLTNHSSLNTYSLRSSNGQIVRDEDEVTVSGLGSNESAVATVSVTRAGYTTETLTVTGRSSTTAVTTAPVTATPAVASESTQTAAAPTPAIGQSSVATIAPGSPTTAPPSPMQKVAPLITPAEVLPELVEPLAKGAAATPTPPTAEAGSAGVVVDGVESSATVTRSNNTLNVVGGGVVATVSGVSPEGERISLDADGNLRLSDGDQIVVEASGFVSGEEIGVWLFSTPTQLGSLTADVAGKISGRFALPLDIESGDHRLVLEGVNSDGSPVVLGLGIAVGEIESSSTLARLLIAIPVVLAIGLGLLIPTRLRRRRQASAGV